MARFVALLALALAAGPATAAASFPGDNGPFVVSLSKCSSYHSYLARVSSTGGDPKPLTSTCDDFSQDPPPFEDTRAPEASPDRFRLLAVQATNTGSGLLSMTPFGGDRQFVPFPEHPDFRNPGYGLAPSYAPDGNRVVLDGGQGRRLWIVRLDTGAAHPIRGEIPCGRNWVSLTSPRWSPDGKLLAVSVSPLCRSRKARPAKAGLWLMRVRDGKFLRRIAGSHATTPDWSPDGSRLVYSTHYQQREVEGGASGGNLYVVSRDGRHVRTLVHRHDIAETHPTWSPNGRWIAWVSLEFGAGDVGFDAHASIWRVRPNGRERRRLTSLPDPYVEEGDFHAPELTWLSR